MLNCARSTSQKPIVSAAGGGTAADVNAFCTHRNIQRSAKMDCGELPRNAVLTPSGESKLAFGAIIFQVTELESGELSAAVSDRATNPSGRLMVAVRPVEATFR